MDKDELSKAYNSGKSMMEIARLFDCSPGTVRYWMQRYLIKRRGLSEAIYLKQNPDGDPFEIKIPITSEENVLYGLGIGIYWGEGTKAEHNSLRVTNTDPAMLNVFIRFLKQLCGVDENKIRYSIICFNDTKPEIAREYWSKQLKISSDKFGKITQIPTQGKGTYKKKSKFGVCIVAVGNTKLKAWILKQIEEMRINLPR